MDACLSWEDFGDDEAYKKWRVTVYQKLEELTQLREDLDRVVAGVPAARLIEKHWIEYRQRVRRPTRDRAATRLASWWKALPAQRVFKTFIQAKRANEAAVKLQRFWREELERRRVVMQEELAKHAALVSRVQALWRGRVARRRVRALRQEIAGREAELRAATFIQAVYKRNEKKRRTLVEGIAAAKVGRVWKQFVSRRKLQEQMCAEYIQLYWRTLNRRKWKRARENRAATVVQSVRRGNIARRETDRQRELIVQLQARRRGTLARRKAKDLRETIAHDNKVLHAATFLQAIFKGNRQRQTFLYEKMMVMKVQQAWKRFIERRRAETAAAIRIQWAWRAFKRGEVRTRARHERASTIIQSVWRGNQARRETVRQRDLILRLQARWRGALARREVEELKEAILLESRVIDAMTFIQAIYKGNKQRRKFLWERMMVMRVQRTWKRFIWKQRLKRKRATKTIQLYWRGRRVAKEARHQAALALQTSIRTALWRRRLREHEVECFNRRTAEYAARCLTPRHPGSAWSGYTMVSRVEEADTATLRYPVNEWGLTRDGVLLNGLDPRTTPFTRITVQVKCFRNERITINRMDLASRVIQRWWRLTRAGGTSWGIFTSGGSNSWLDMIREYASAEMARRRGSAAAMAVG
ncbi:hypothetical protein FOZ60_008245 [Perkinsus olseni]|uniref:Uncharacterized protein n=1 Tax=Perkinsus olseni TaxID=32597 RepID=A0A7J6PE19_PEROL|nr:hypothetical protein FOZ60_008245 [Perkinsus olseni]